MDAPVKMIFPGHSRISLWHKNVAGIAGSRSAPRGYEESYSRTGILLRSFTDALQMLYRCFADTAKLVDDFRK